MNKEIVLSIDDKCLQDPSLIGLSQEELSQLKVYSKAQELREYLNSVSSHVEVWVVASNDIEAINLAAAIKKDRPNITVCLICFSFSGSLKSRANAAKIDTVLNVESFKERFHAKDIEKKYEVPKSSNIVTGKKAFMLPVFSASGGAGKSSVSVISAVLSQMCGNRTLLIDADLQFGDAAVLLGETKPITIDEIINNRGTIAQLKPSENNPSILASPAHPEMAEKILDEFPALLEVLRQSFDVIIVNTGSLWGEQQAILLERDSKSLFLVDQRPTSLNATKRAIDLCGRCGIPTGSVKFAINKVSKNALFTSADISSVLDISQVYEIIDGGVEVDEYLANGKAKELIDSRNPFVISLWSILADILPKTKEKYELRKPESQRRSLFGFTRKRA